MPTDSHDLALDATPLNGEIYVPSTNHSLAADVGEASSTEDGEGDEEPALGPETEEYRQAIQGFLDAKPGRRAEFRKFICGGLGYPYNDL